MSTENIEQLLEKYLEASTTIAEEQQLAQYFSTDNVATHLLSYQPLFKYFKKSKQTRSARTTTVKTSFSFYKWTAVAASTLLLLGFFTKEMIQQQTEKEEALLAYYETKKALQFMSTNFNHGAKNVQHLNTYSITKNKIFKSN